MHATDWLPTLVSIASEGKFSNYSSLDGMNLWDALQNEKPSPRTEVLINIDPHVQKNSALRIGDWKLVNQSMLCIYIYIYVHLSVPAGRAFNYVSVNTFFFNYVYFYKKRLRDFLGKAFQKKLLHYSLLFA